MTNFIREYLPYCLRNVGKNKWVILNRNYAHIGTFNKDNLEDFAININITTTKQKKLSIEENFNNDIYLYNDKTNPLKNKQEMIHYMEKLKILADLEIL